ncbi:LysM peptidoglycan-binding domain-containing protein [Paenibacillus apiarius]|uniref:LysM peptidoglycan-binding domain-containing protein n=1 Tax=Paenibacillus apiarius TaxID=46240 RepID=A0ABT4DU11_9BACL|nr:LysM peptidoglycan-binding domain-containing protein [Paenibacillus apiarius]MBN3527485.1 LysM peptidoglycan-binding domain-containing protein [Paenibacillus apiarius]MCY9515904.1 LysM peptidoglycan-binding domain-containing protein [Paenibacillus apiarius]MCY9520814.1 LysM peptidoglycan-binding domain-containing protein [Paenibacillus apiarius]MCY9553519.1 LysM peptidoglycan-binding domain-containing protein [Paenibacillus apiarius]MCY9557958.1 LysM peptidoglycan-binding domain-containing 
MMYTTYRSIYNVSTTASEGKGKQRRSHHIRRLRLIVFTIALFFVTCGSIVQAWGDDAQEPAATESAVERVLVQPGDSLWAIAAAYKPEHMDIRQYIYEIIVLNDMEGHTLLAGDVLFVPLDME